jgi:two-component system chemotaxis sensor kinase CheA
MAQDTSMINEFLVEAREHLTSIENDLLVLEDKDNQNDQTIIDRLFRAIHSIKGSSSFLNLTQITQLSNSMETLMQKCRNTGMQDAYIDVFLKGVDTLNQLLDNPLDSESISITNICIQLKHAIDGSSFEDNSNAEQTPEKKPDQPTEHMKQNMFNINVTQLADFGFNVDISQLSSEKYLYILRFDIFNIEKEKELFFVSFMRNVVGMGKIIDAKTSEFKDLSFSDIESIQNLDCEFLYESALTKDEMLMMIGIPDDNIFFVNKDVSQSAKTVAPTQQDRYENIQQDIQKSSRPHDNNQIGKDVQQSHSEKRPHQKNKKNSPVGSPSLPQKNLPDKSKEKQANVKRSSTIKAESIRISIDILDKIMNLAGELVLVRNQQMLVIDKTNPQQSDIAQRLDMVTSELQEAIMRTRMQPVKQLFSRLPRIVRDISRKINKSIVVITSGDEVELDKNILESLSDPLIHIIRNACDHGIESPEARASSGKPETGCIKIHAYHEAGQINIKIEDDGKGINPETIKQKALQKELKSEKEINMMNDKDLLRLIMLPGFTTAARTTEISGRGVGMDVVKESVEQMSGSIELSSELNEGTTIHLRLPLTLAIIPSLVVVVDNERLAIPEVNVEELVSLYDKEIYTLIETNGDQEVFRLRKSLLPLVRLNEVLKRKDRFTESVRFEISEKYNRVSKQMIDNETEDFQEILVFAVLKAGNQRFGLIVDQVLGTEEIVVNPLHSLINPINIYSGTTIMGDGTVALILDINGIANHCGLTFSNVPEKDETKSKGSNQSDSHRILLFKSGKNEQFAVPLLLMKRVEIISPQQIQEIGDREYISIERKTIQVVRLEKFLNVSSVTTSQRMFLLIPKQSPQPIGFLASKLIDVINMPLDLSKEDYMEEGLLGTSLIGETITLFIDIYKILGKIFEDDSLEIQAERQTSPDKKQVKILLAEDTVFFKRLIKGQLLSEGFSVTTAENGVEALEKLENESFDFIVSDIEMPEMDGLTFIKTVRNNPKFKHIPAIAVTSLDSPEDRQNGINAGFDGYQVKIDKEKLIKSIKHLLNNKEG